ncbi:MAG: phosphatase PAP2 family protein [Bauldia sp.]|nr:phosphatase PAP2 family protein [Bauldia sp.]
MAREWPVVALLLLPAAALWGFILIADEVIEGETHGFDTAVLVALRNPADLSDPIGPPWLEEMMRDFTALGGVGVLTLMAAGGVGYLLLLRKRRAALFLAVAVGGGMLASSLLKMFFSRPRPDLVPHESYVYTTSFPSGHSMMSAVVYLTLAVMLSRVEARGAVKAYLLGVAVLVVVLIGISRVYLGVHWPTDVLAGWAAGAAWALGCWALVTLLQRRGALESPE